MSSAPTIKPTDGQRAVWLGALIVAALVVLLYVPALGNEFVNWDDDIYVYNNPWVKSLTLSSLVRALTHTHAASGNWHPLTILSHSADYALWGLRPAGHHLTSILLHGLNAALVVVLVLRLLRARGDRNDRRISPQGTVAAAVVAGLLFGLHPLRVESVAWVSERKDLLAALFYLLGMLSYLRYARSTETATGTPWKDRHYLTTLLCFVLSLLSKPMAVSFPFVLLIIDWFPLCRVQRGQIRRRLVEKIPFLVLDVGLAVVTLLAQKASGAFRPLAEVSLGPRLLVAIKGAALYLGKTVLPTGLRPFYSYPAQASLASWEFGVPALLMIALLVGCVLAARTSRVFLAGLACYGVVLLPVLGIVKIGSAAMADRYTYLPSLPVVALVGAGFGRLWDTSAGWRKGALALAGLSVLGLLSWQTTRQIGFWRNSEILWSRVLAYEPWNTEAYNNRASARYERGEFEKALADYDAAIRQQPLLGPRHTTKRRAAYFNDRAITYVRLGRYAEAIADEGEAIALRPGEASYYLNRGNMYLALGRPAEALDDVNRAVAASPVADPALLRKRGLLYRRLGMEDKRQR